MQNLKYLERVIDEENRFGVILNEIAMKKTDHIQLRIALSLLEFFNSGKFINEDDIEKIKITFYVSKEKYFKTQTIPKSKVFSIRSNLNDSEEKLDEKIDNLRQRIRRYQNKKET